jgi:CobQ-like glutamine amidotransferase family enzyme
MSRDSAVRIGALLPDVLGVYSDNGNVTVLAQRLRWRGIPVEVCMVTAGTDPPVNCDLYVIGGGEDAAQIVAADWLRAHRGFCAALAGPATTFAVCAGLQVLGRWMQDASGRRRCAAEIIDVTTSPGRRRAVGEVVSVCELPGVGTLTGFENHRGVTRLAPGTRPLARVVRGAGNGTSDRSDGVLAGSVIGTYLHGPVLARNPALADEVLRRVLGRNLPPLEVPDQDSVRRARLSGNRVGHSFRSWAACR